MPALTGVLTTSKASRSRRTAVPAPEKSAGSAALDTLTAGAPSSSAPTMVATLTLAPHPANPAHRSERGFEDLAEQIRAEGGEIHTPLIVRPCSTSAAYQVLSGSRRLAAARFLGMLLVPVVVRDDVDDAAALRIVLAENLNRMDFTESEQADLVQGILDLGLTETQVAEQLGKGKDWIARRRAVAKLAAPAKAVLDARPDLDLVDAAAIAEFDDDPNTMHALAKAASDYPARFVHELSRARQDRETTALIAAERPVWEAKGYTILTEAPGWNDSEIKDIDNLSTTSNGRGLTTKQHETCPGRAAYITVRRTYGTEEKVSPYVIEYCTTWKTAGHFNRHASTSSGATSGPMDEKQKAERKHLIETNKASDAALPVRLAWLEQFFRRDKLPADALTYAVQILSDGCYSSDISHAAAYALTHPAKKGTSHEDRTYWLSRPGNATKHLVALAVSSVEENLPRDYHRSLSSRTGAHLSQLAAWGYPLAPHEQTYVDAWAKTNKPAKEVA